MRATVGAISGGGVQGSWEASSSVAGRYFSIFDISFIDRLFSIIVQFCESRLRSDFFTNVDLICRHALEIPSAVIAIISANSGDTSEID